MRKLLVHFMAGNMPRQLITQFLGDTGLPSQIREAVYANPPIPNLAETCVELMTKVEKLEADNMRRARAIQCWSAQAAALRAQVRDLQQQVLESREREERLTKTIDQEGFAGGADVGSPGSYTDPSPWTESQVEMAMADPRIAKRSVGAKVNGHCDPT